MKNELKIILTLVIFGMFLLPSSILATNVKNVGFENDEMISYEYVSDHEIHITYKMQEILQEEGHAPRQGLQDCQEELVLS